MIHPRISVVGCGSHSTNNIQPNLAYARCEFDSVCDIDRAAAERNARIFGAGAVYESATRMMDERKPDGVMVIGPPNLHYTIAKAALERGIPVFTEKPCAPDYERAVELASIAKANGAFLMTGYMKRQGLAYRKIREMIDSGEFTPAAGWIRYAHWPQSDLNSMLLGMSIHAIDLAIFLFGDPVELSSHLSRGDREQISLGVTMRFQSGKWAQLMLDSSQPRIQERVEISGSIDGKNALIIVDNVQHMEIHTYNSSGIDLVVSSPNSWRNAELWEIDPRIDLTDIKVWRPDYAIPNMGQTRLFFQGFAGEVREFADALREGREANPGTDESIKAMRVIDALIKRPDGVTMA